VIRYIGFEGLVKRMYKSMKRIFLLMLFLALPGCARIDDGRTKITYQTMETLPEQRKALAQMVKEFEEQYPHIRVEVFTSTTSFQKLLIQIAAGNAPDVFYYVTDRLPGLVKGGVVADLTARMKEVELDEYFREIVDSCAIDGKYYLFPFHYSTDVLFYNKDLFDKMGVGYPDENWRWDDFLNAAVKLTVKKNGRTVQYGTLQPRPLLMIKSFGGRCFNDSLTKCMLNSPETKKALQYIIDLDQRYGVAPLEAVINDMERMDGVDMFSAGKVAMLLGRTFMLAEFRKLKYFDWDIAPIPVGKIPYSRLAVGGNCISAESKHPEEAWQFAEFYSGRKGSEICGTSGNCVPALKKVAYSEDFLAAPPQNAILFVDSIQYARTDNPGLVCWEEFYQRVVQENADKIICGNISVDEGLREMEREGNKLLRNCGR